VSCAVCQDSGHVCENHPDRAWGYLVEGGCECGGAGMPCPECCSPVPMDGTHSITEAFVPDHLRAASS
jgi:bifunctional non-homologous end joining protein LigD